MFPSLATFVLNFKDPATTYFHSLITVHHDAMWYLILILAIVYWNLFKIVKESNWSVFNKQYGFFLVFFRRFFFQVEIFFFYMLSLVLSFTKFYHLFLLNSHSNFVSSILTSTPNNTIASRFHNFQRGYESILGYSNEVPNIYTVRSFSVFSKTFFDLFVEKYIDYFLFNRLNLIYWYYNETRNNARFFLNARSFSHSSLFEFVCASFPTLIILFILIPSTLLLYSLDEELQPSMSFRVLGHQWYWSYEFFNWIQQDDLWFKIQHEFESTMITDDNLVLGGRRLLEVDNTLPVPVNVPLRFLISSSDVLHSWAIPELGIKIDAIPGRLSHYLTLVRRPGVFYGQCSEICGVAHGFMPIVIKAF